MVFTPSINDLPPDPQVNQQLQGQMNGGGGYIPSSNDIPDLSNNSQPQPPAQDATGPAPQPNQGSSMGMSMIAGASNAGADAAGTVFDAGIWAANKLGIVSDQAAQGMKNATQFTLDNNVAGLGVGVTSGQPGQTDSFSQAAAQHPWAANSSQYGLDTGMLVATGGMGLGLKAPEGAAIGSKLLTGAINMTSRIAGQGLLGAGISGPDQQAQDTGAAIAATLTPLGDAIAGGVVKGANAINLVSSKIKDFLAPLNKQLLSTGDLTVEEQAIKSEAAFTSTTMATANSLYKTIKDIPGTIAQFPIQKSIFNVLQTAGSAVQKVSGSIVWNHGNTSLDDSLIAKLQGFQQQAGQLKTMEDALMFKQDLSAAGKLFARGNVASPVADAFSSVKNLVSNMIKQKASANGADRALESADSFWRFHVIPLQDSGAVDRMKAVFTDNLKPPTAPSSPAYLQGLKQMFKPNMTPQDVKALLQRTDKDGAKIVSQYFIKNIFNGWAVNPESFDKNAALMKINDTIEKYGSVLGKESIDTMRGMKNLLVGAGAVARKEGIQSSSYFLHAAGMMIGGSLGGFAGYHEGGGAGAMMGGLIGLKVAPAVADAASSGIKGLLDTTYGQKILQYISGNPSAVQKLLQPAVQGIPASLSNKNGQ